MSGITPRLLSQSKIFQEAQKSDDDRLDVLEKIVSQMGGAIDPTIFKTIADLKSGKTAANRVDFVPDTGNVGSVAPGTFLYQTGNFFNRTDDKNIVKRFGIDLTVGAWVRQSATNIGFKQQGADFNTSVDDALNTFASPAQFRQDSDVDDTTKIRKLFASGRKIIFVPEGNYVISGEITIPGRTLIICAPGAEFIVGGSNFRMFKTDQTTYGTRWIGGTIYNPNRFPGVTAMDLIGFRNLGAAIEGLSIVGTAIGIYLRELCWDLALRNCYMEDITNVGIVIGKGTNAVTIDHPAINGFGFAGIQIQAGPPDLINSINNIRGGYIQGGQIGIQDFGHNTHIQDTYFEYNSVTDISLLNAIMPVIRGTGHLGTGGQFCVFSASTQGAHVTDLVLDGDRSGGIFNFDDSNSDCVATMHRAGGLNIKLGIIAGIHYNNNRTGTPRVGNFGYDDFRHRMGAYYFNSHVGAPLWREVMNNFDNITIGGDTAVNAAQEGTANYRVVADQSALEVVSADNGQSFKFFLKWNGPVGTMTINGIPVDMTGVAEGKRKVVTVTKVSADADAIYLDEGQWK